MIWKRIWFCSKLVDVGSYKALAAGEKKIDAIQLGKDVEIHLKSNMCRN